MAEKLASHAAELSAIIFRAVNNGALKPSDHGIYRTAGETATNLYLISTCLDSLPPYWIGVDLEHVCCEVLEHLNGIDRPGEPIYSNFLLGFTQFASQPSRNNRKDLEQRVMTFFKAQKGKAESLKLACDKLLQRLTKDGDDAHAVPDSALYLDTPEVSKDLKNGVFEALKVIVECNQELHSSDDKDDCTAAPSQVVIPRSRHPARLCLHKPGNIEILVSAMDMSVWQEFGMLDDPTDAVHDHEKLCQGGFCSLLEENLTLRLFLSFKDNHIFLLKKRREVLKQIVQDRSWASLKTVLRDYELTPKDKIILSYAIAWSYWQYYDSDLMRAQWTSETVLFVPAEVSGEHKDQLPLCAYIEFPFEVSSSPREEILSEELMLTHRCPRIFDIGVLLLEIGLAKPFRPGQRKSLVAQANLSHKMAIDNLIELEKASWEGATNMKKHFNAAVKFCLKSENFTPSQKQGNATQADDILNRKRIFYKNVVCPLAWMAKRGFRAEAGEITYISKKPNNSQSWATDLPWQTEPQGLFHSGTTIDPKKWLKNLQMIGAEVGRRRRKEGVKTPIRVAILDSGLDRDLPAFKSKKSLLECIADEKDFVGTSPLSTSTGDEFGHGTFMARLIMESIAPGVEITVARVAQNTDKLEGSQQNIKEAILWAGREGKADIVSMSFGFRREDRDISEAIETVKKERKDDIIFLASAGNSFTDDESFPACHPAVISVFATDRYGTFLQSNSASTNHGAIILGTFGDDIPQSIKDEFATEQGTTVCQPGSSVATAIMAGISATMLAYADTLYSFGPKGSASSQVLRCLRTTRGMEAVLRQVPQPRQNVDDPWRKAVNPIQFWKDSPTDWDRYCVLYNALTPVYQREFDPSRS